jgi:hypothetical protein
LLKRFPEGKHASRAQELLDKADMHFAVEQARNRGSRPMKSEGERLLLEAEKYERSPVPDRITALETYQSMVDLLSGSPDERVYVLIAKQRLEAIKAEGGNKLDRHQILDDGLKRAEDLLASEKSGLFEARNIWSSIVTLYANNQELAPYVNRAQQRLEETRPGRQDSNR